MNLSLPESQSFVHVPFRVARCRISPMSSGSQEVPATLGEIGETVIVSVNDPVRSLSSVVASTK